MKLKIIYRFIFGFYVNNRGGFRISLYICITKMTCRGYAKIFRCNNCHFHFSLAAKQAAAGDTPFWISSINLNATQHVCYIQAISPSLYSCWTKGKCCWAGATLYRSVGVFVFSFSLRSVCARTITCLKIMCIKWKVVKYCAAGAVVRINNLIS